MGPIAAWLTALALLAAPRQSPAAHGTMTMASNPLGVSSARDGSGTSWLPDDTHESSLDRMAGSWMLMVHGNAFVQAIDVTGARGSHQAGSVNWIMAMADREAAGGRLALRAMMSLEPVTVGPCGYPDLFQSGESCRGAALHDEQHPHDLFMEVAADYRHAIGDGFAVELYGGPAGEPALGPVAYPHRPSAMEDPIAPIGHHWLDSTHISFGVVSGAAYGRHWKIDASVFNGREPDDRRDGFDLAPLDSYSGRVTWLPDRHWALQMSAGRLTDAETDPTGLALDIVRTTASAIYVRTRDDGRVWAVTMATGVDREAGVTTPALLFETSFDATGRTTIFARAEAVRKTPADLALPADTDAHVPVKLQVGYARHWRAGPHATFSAGGAYALGLVPSTWQSIYGGATASELTAFVRIAPSR